MNWLLIFHDSVGGAWQHTKTDSYPTFFAAAEALTRFVNVSLSNRDAVGVEHLRSTSILTWPNGSQTSIRIMEDI